MVQKGRGVRHVPTAPTHKNRIRWQTNVDTVPSVSAELVL